jgi:hypothetical protein
MLLWGREKMLFFAEKSPQVRRGKVSWASWERVEIIDITLWL